MKISSVNVLHITFQTGEKIITAEVNMLQEIEAVTIKQPSFWYTLVPSNMWKQRPKAMTKTLNVQ